MKLVFNQVWEDPDVIEQALCVSAKDTVVTIGSAGCTALNLAIHRPKCIYAIDVNPAQTALLELKIAAASLLNHDSFWELFGKGQTKNFSKYYGTLREKISIKSREFWDNNGRIFQHGLYSSGTFGRALSLLRGYLHFVCGSDGIRQLLAAKTISKQRSVYAQLQPRIWNRVAKGIPLWTMRFYGLNSMQIKRMKEAGAKTIADVFLKPMNNVMTNLPISANFFWHQILLGRYASQNIAPPYLLRPNYECLRNARNIIIPVTSSIEKFLASQPARSITAFNVSDVIDWLSEENIELLWREIVRTAATGARILVRSETPHAIVPSFIREKVALLRPKSEHLLSQDRTGSYASVFLFRVPDKA